MNKILTGKRLPFICLLATGLSANPAFADWIYNPAQSQYKKKYGDFPPENIDQQLLENRYIEDQPEESEIPAANKLETHNTPEPYATQNYAAPGSPSSTYQPPGYTGLSQSGSASRYGRTPRSHNTTGFSGPWNSRGSGFSAPWNNSRSGFRGPWNSSRGSGFSMPWNNRGSSFSGPWDSNGSSFSGPWNNNGSSFKPWGN